MATGEHTLARGASADRALLVATPHPAVVDCAARAASWLDRRGVPGGSVRPGGQPLVARRRDVAAAESSGRWACPWSRWCARACCRDPRGGPHPAAGELLGGAGRVTDPAGLVARYRDRIRREVLEHGPPARDPRAALAARTRALLRSEVAAAAGDLDRLVEAMLDDALGVGPLEPLMRDPDVTEVIANGPDHVYAERRGLLRREQVSVRGRGAPAPRDRADRDARSAGAWTSPARWSTRACPTAAASTPCFRRVALDGPLLTIRRFAAEGLSIDDMVASGLADLRPGRAAGRLRARGRAERRCQRRHRDRQDDAPERDGGIHRRVTSASSRSRTRPSCASPSRTWRVWRRGRRTSRAAVRSSSARSCETRCACGPTGSWSARCAVPRRWTCCRR